MGGFTDLRSPVYPPEMLDRAVEADGNVFLEPFDLLEVGRMAASILVSLSMFRSVT